jgi:hypothetical protein
VTGDTEHRVCVAFVVPVATGLNRNHALPPLDRPASIAVADAMPSQNSLAASWNAFRTSSHAA